MFKRQFAWTLAACMIFLGAGSHSSLREDARFLADTLDGPPYEPGAALATFEIADGFTIELFVAEPLVMDPVDMEVDEFGRLYVVEMPGYPLNTAGSGRVALLSDIDRDGYPDTRTLFAGGFTMPTGIMRWKAGILVTDAPNVWYLVDEDGDGRAGRREIILTGFALSNPQHNFNNPLYGLDNGIYLANESPYRTELYADLFGDEGEPVRYTSLAGAPVLSKNAGSRNVRFRPDTGELEELAGRSQFGHTFDPWGRQFMVSNAHHHFHEAIAARYLRRNPALPVAATLAFTPDHGNAAVVYPITYDPEHQLLTDRGVFTAASGITYYSGGAFPEPYDRATFVAESVHNLVHADLVEQEGASFRARRMLEGREFLASTDSWFRPVNFFVGPDGALFVLDYYRRIVEHPEWMDEETVNSGRLYDGMERGRIYRITAGGAAAPAWLDRLGLGEESDSDLVERLDEPNMWWRLHAQRLLVDRALAGNAGEIAELLEMAAGEVGVSSRVHALWALEGMQRLDEQWIRSALSDPEPGIRENAIRLAEAHGAAGFERDLLELVDDPNPRVRFQLLLTLGDLSSEAVAGARRIILARDLADEWIQLASLTAGNAPTASELRQVFSHLEGKGALHYLSRMASLLGAASTKDDISETIQFAATASPETTAALLEGIAEGLRRRQGEKVDLLEEMDLLYRRFFESEDPEFRQAVIVLGRRSGASSSSNAKRAMQIAATDSDPLRRADMLHLVAMAAPEPFDSEVRRIIADRPDSRVEAAAVEVLARIDPPDLASYLLSNWATLSREAREASLNAIISDNASIVKLLNAVAARDVSPEEIGWNRRVRLMQNDDADIQVRARRLLHVTDASREEVVRSYEPAAVGAGDSQAGQAVFFAACARCHVARGFGAAFGPDLGTVAHWSPRALIDAILVPARSVPEGFEHWRVERRDGEVLTGVIRSETATALVVATEGGREVLVARAEIASARLLAGSAMPDGLESQISVEEMRDLIAFLRQPE